MYGIPVIQWCIFMFAIAVAEESTIEPDFVTEPNNTAVGEGLTAILTCSVINLGSQYTVHWLKDGLTFTNNETVYYDLRLANIPESTRYTLVRETNGEYNLQIVHTFKEDEGMYWCMISENGPGQLKASIHAELIVETPVENYPRCVPYDLNDHYYEGDTLEVYCMFKNSDPLPVLQWWDSNRLLGGERLYSSVPDISYQWQLNSSDNGKSIQCVVNETSSCSVGPVEVYYKPKQVIVSQNAEVIVGQLVIFSVTFSSNPSPSSYHWSVNGVNISRSFSRFHINGPTFTITNTYQSDDGAEVTCTVINVVGNTTATGTIRLLPLPSTITTSVEATTTPINGKDTTFFDPSQLGRGVQQSEDFPVIVIAVTAGGASIFFIAVVIGVAVFVSSCRDKRKKPKSGVVQADSLFQINMYNRNDEQDMPPTTPSLPPRNSFQQDDISDTSIGTGYFSTKRRLHVKDIFSQVNDTEVSANNKQNEDNEQRCIGLSDTDTDYVVIENPSFTENSSSPDPDIIQDTHDKSEIESGSESGVKRPPSIDDSSEIQIPDFHFISDDSTTDVDDNSNCGDDNETKEENVDSEMIFENFSVSEGDNSNNTKSNNEDGVEELKDDNTETLPSGTRLMYVD
ncbi:uncharacterized protein LOC144453980 [Glandiceps talaboti]